LEIFLNNIKINDAYQRRLFLVYLTL